jgi:hypothetical protein
MNWQTYSSDSFISACIGLNVAFVAWGSFRQKVGHIEEMAKARGASLIATMNDASTGTSGVILRAGVNAGQRLNAFFLRAIDVAAILAAIYGMALLYLKHSGPWDAILILPFPIYWLYVAFSWVVITFIVSSFDNVAPLNSGAIRDNVTRFAATLPHSAPTPPPLAPPSPPAIGRQVDI